MSNTRLAGLAMPFDWNGKRLFLGKKDYDLELEFQRQQEGNLRRRILAHRQGMGESEYAEQMTGWRRDLAANVCAFGEPTSWSYLWTTQGLREYVWLKFKKGEAQCQEADEFSRDDLEALAADPVAWRELQLTIMEMDFPNLLQPESREELRLMRERRKKPSASGGGATSPEAAA